MIRTKEMMQPIKEMMQPCSLYLHAISLVARPTLILAGTKVLHLDYFAMVKLIRQCGRPMTLVRNTCCRRLHCTDLFTALFQYLPTLVRHLFDTCSTLMSRQPTHLLRCDSITIIR